MSDKSRVGSSTTVLCLFRGSLLSVWTLEAALSRVDTGSADSVQYPSLTAFQKNFLSA